MTQEIAAASERACTASPCTQDGPFSKHANTLLLNGYSPLTILPGTKRPTEKEWSERCETPLDVQGIERLCREFPKAGVGVACGYGGLVAIDVDTDDPVIIAAIEAVLPEALITKRGKRGYTLFFRTSEPIHTRIFKTPKGHAKKGETIVEILALGRQTVLPPTIHPDTGKPYEWRTEETLFDTRLEDLPLVADDIDEKIEAAIAQWIEGPEDWLGEDFTQEVVHAHDFNDGTRKRYIAFVNKAIEEQVQELAAMAPDSGRNDALNGIVYRLGKFVHHRIISREELEAPFIEACRANGLMNDGRHAVIATIRSALKASRKNPLRALAERERPNTNGERPFPGAETAAAPLDRPPDEWGIPEPLVSKIEPLPYPIDALPPTIRKAVEEARTNIMAPVPLIAGCALSALAAAAQGLVDVERMNGLRGPVSPFFLTIAMSGDRKSTADKLFTAAIKEYEKEQREKFAPLIKTYLADLKKWKATDKGIQAAMEAAAKGRPFKGSKAIAELENDLRENEKREPREPRVPQLIRGDDTSESLAWDLAKKWPSAAIISSEAGIVFGGHAMGPEAIMRNLALQNTLWDGGEHKVGRRVSESFTVDNARLSVGLQVQEEALRHFCEKNGELARGMGYFARFLFAWPRSLQGEREIIGEPSQIQPAVAAFNRKLSVLLNTPVSVDDESGALSLTLLSMSPGGKAKWIELFNGIERELRLDGELRDIRDVASKAPDNIARLAAIFHVFEYGANGSISVESVREAGEIVLWHLSEARRFFGGLAMPPELVAAECLEGWLVEQCKKIGTSIVLRRDVQRLGPNKLRRKKALNEAIAELSGLGRVREIANAIHVNPAVLSGGSQ